MLEKSDFDFWNEPVSVNMWEMITNVFIILQWNSFYFLCNSFVFDIHLISLTWERKRTSGA